MLSNLSDRFYAWSRGWLILALLAALTIFIMLTLPLAQAGTDGEIGLDSRFSYTPEEALAAVAAYSPDGRATLRTFYLTADIVNPILYTAFLVLLLSWLFQRGFAPASFIRKLNVLPLGAALFDLIENLGIVIMLSSHPAQPGFAASLASFGTTAKYVFLYASFALALVGLIAAAMRRFRPQP